MCECKLNAKNHAYELLNYDYYIHILISREYTPPVQVPFLLWMEELEAFFFLSLDETK